MFLSKTIFTKAGTVLVMSFSFTALLADGVATEQIWGSDVSMQPNMSYDEASLRISSNDIVVSKSFQPEESITVSVAEMNDGLYGYLLSLNSVSGNNQDTTAEQSGQFRITNGTASVYNDEISEAEAAEQDEVRRAQLSDGNYEEQTN